MSDLDHDRWYDANGEFNKTKYQMDMNAKEYRLENLRKRGYCVECMVRYETYSKKTACPNCGHIILIN